MLSGLRKLPCPFHHKAQQVICNSKKVLQEPDHASTLILKTTALAPELREISFWFFASLPVCGILL